MGAEHAGLLLERHSDITRLRDSLQSAVQGRGSVAVVDGPSGVGKTALLHDLRDWARQQGVRVLFGRCSQVERDFSFGLVRQLYTPALTRSGHRSTLLSGVAALAAPLFEWSEEDLDAGPSPVTDDVLHARLNGLYWLTSNLAEQAPLVLAIDDAHLADLPSMRFLSFLSRRVEELPVLMLLTSRFGERPEGDELVAQISTDSSTQVIRPVPLGANAVEALLEASIGKVGRGFSRVCHEITGGNPFLLRELVRELDRKGIAPEDANVEALRHLSPVSVSQSLLTRLASLHPSASALAAAVAVLGDGVDLRQAAGVAELSTEEAGEAADNLAAWDVLEAGRPLRFAHAIVRNGVYGTLPHAVRTRLHYLAALILEADGMPPDQVASHLLATDPLGRPTVVETLRKAAARALALGDPDLAVACLRRALEEPPPPEARTEVLLELCLAEIRLPGPEVLHHLRRGLELTSEPEQRARIALELARAIGMIADTAGALELLDHAIADLRRVDADLALRLEAELITVGRLYPPTRAGALQRLALLGHRAVPESVSGAILLANQALLAVEEGWPAEKAAALAERALEGGFLVAEETWVLAYAANTLTWTDRVYEAERIWNEALARARHRGSMTIFILASAWRSHLAFRRGSVRDAEEDARLCLNVCRQRDWQGPLPYALAFLVDALIERDELEEASLVIGDASYEDAVHHLLDSRGRLRCAQGRLREGVADLLECGRQLDARGSGRNPAIISWRSSAARALVQLGELEEARRLAGEEVELARRFGAPRALGVALNAMALTQPAIRQLESLAEAVDVLRTSPGRLDEARALVDLGGALRRAGRRSEAQERLRESLDLAHRCGSTALRRAAHQELLAAGLRPQRFVMTGVEALTPSERRVAEMAAAGMANRDIAQSLFVSLKTVEAHLNRVYRKLGVRTRAHLQRALDAQPSVGQAG